MPGFCLKSEGDIQMSNKKTFYKTTWFMWLALILFAPAGIVLLWVYHKQYSKNVKIILSVIFAIFFIIEIIVGNSTDNTIQTANTPETTIIPANETVPEPTSKPDTKPTPEQKQDEKIDVVLDVSVNKNNGKPIFTINTNLPDETDLMLTLKGNKYTGQTHTIVENGVAVSEAFSSKGKAISGKYTLSVSMSEPKFQSDNVRAAIGENGENITGKYVKTSDINNSKFINGDFNFSFKTTEKKKKKSNSKKEKLIKKYDNEIVVNCKLLLDRFVSNYKIPLATQLWTIVNFDDKGAVMAITDITEKSTGNKEKTMIVLTPYIENDEMTGAKPHYVSIGDTVYGNDGYCDDFFSKIQDILDAQ